MSDLNISILIDTREQAPWKFETPTVRGTLNVGDYSIPGCEGWICIERKSLDDLIGCLSHDRDRFVRELERARRIEIFYVIVEASYSDVLEKRYRGEMHPHAAWESVIAFQQRYRIPFLFSENRDIASRLGQSILCRWWKEHWKVFAAVRKACAFSQ